ncbi:Rapid ALkalinization Factor [Quillaja saponaria]|uniref:Rapid ALkalinization Factor n=1 Tax=Quillaja saponaria TaxID=32244 RepID=A0AAD7P9U0_QUISA|nr:Rapid ALkalinization Factor [Quillaja saponaria]
MDSKPWLVLLLLAVAMVATQASSIHDAGWKLTHHFNRVDLSTGSVGDFIGEENEMLLDSESSRRQLGGRGRYISYGALRANQVPCGRRGQSYYNCNRRKRANPYRRGCNRITHCARG